VRGKLHVSRRRFLRLAGTTVVSCFCTRFGCEVDAKAMPVNTHIPPALKTGLYEVRPFCKVTRVNLGTDGLATGLTYIRASLFDR
jgi:hypothetical protein